jgi:Thioesterase-like superfamily
VIGRITMELLGPVPVGPLTVTASVVRPGRSVALVEAVLSTERPVARARAWLFPTASTEAAVVGPAPEHSPSDGEEHPPPPGWGTGYLESVDWRWVEGAVMQPGPAVVWMRPRVTLLPGEEWSPLQRLMACVDSASGASSVLDPREWGFLNTELTVHVLRPPVGEWVCLDAVTTLSSGSVGLATSSVYDEQGLVARSAQALLIQRRAPRA